MRKILIITGLFALSFVAFAQKDTTNLGEYVVTGTRFELPVEKSGKTVFKYGEQEIKNYAARSVADLLNEVPAIQVDGNFSNPGTNLEYYIRGARSRYTLVLIDGIPMNDPTGINLFYDLRYLSLNQVKSIEIVKGGLSALYGSNAAAGVINIQLKDNTKEDFAVSVGANTGSFGALGYHADVSGNAGIWNYGLSFNRKTIDGFSAAESTDPNTQFDDDSFAKTNLTFRSNLAFNNNFDLKMSLGYDQFSTDLDAFAFTDELNAFSDYEQMRLTLSPSFKHRYGSSVLNFQYASIERDFQNAFPTLYQGNNMQFDQTNKFDLSENIRALFGWNLQFLQDQTAENNHQFTIFDPYLSVIYDLTSGFNLHLGARLNTHSDYDNSMLYTVNPSWSIDLNQGWMIKPFASFSNSYNTPSLYQINNELYGNANLNPEKTDNYEVGTSVYVREKFTLNAALFQRIEDSAIDFRSFFNPDGSFAGGEYFNLVDSREVQGLELDGSYSFGQIQVEAHYSKLATNNDESFARIPKLKYGLSVAYAHRSDLHLQLAYQYTGERRASPFNEVLLEEYGLVNLSARKSFLENRISAFVALNNIFDEDFVGIEGFTTMGRNFNLGFEVKF